MLPFNSCEPCSSPSCSTIPVVPAAFDVDVDVGAMGIRGGAPASAAGVISGFSLNADTTYAAITRFAAKTAESALQT